MFCIKRLSRLTSRLDLHLSSTLRQHSKCAVPTADGQSAWNTSVAQLDDKPQENALNTYLIQHVLSDRAAGSAPFDALFEQLTSKANVQLPHVLPYENNGRKNDTGKSDLARGIVTVAHVLPAAHKVIVASGFAVLDGGLIVTCAHTFYQAAQSRPCSNVDQRSKSLVMTTEGELIGVASIASHLVHSDIVLLRLEDDRKIPSLPVDPYPAPVRTPLLAYEFITATLSAWKPTEVLFYRGPCGQEAEPGTYDTLSSMMHSHPSSNGSSGGPIVSEATSSVVGIVRGNEVNYANRKLIGFAIPSEHLFEAFKLPGMPDDVH